MSALELLKIARTEKPHIHYTINHRHDAIAARHTESDHWVIVAGKLDSGRWVTMTRELWIHGHPATSDWMDETECPTP